MNSQEDYFLFEFLSKLGFHSRTIQELKQNLYHTGKIYESNKEWKAYVDRGKIIINKTSSDLGSQEIEISEEQGLILFNNVCFKIRRIIKIPNEKFDIPHSQNIATLDYEKIKFPLILRAWQAGDSIKPLGMKGMSKKIQDIFTDKKVALPNKKNSMMLVSNKEIIWLVNQCISETVKVTNNTKSMLQIECIEDHDF